MKDKNNQESGTTVKPGEAPGGQAAGNRAGAAQAAPKKEKITLTSDGMASLLKSQFAADSAETAPGEEVQPAAEEAATLEAPSGAATIGTEQEQETETVEEQAAGDADEAAAAAQTEELPPELQSAIDTWEEQGKGALPPALQALFDKRIGKAVAQRETEKTRADAAEARAQELESELAQARQAPANAAAPLSDEKTLLGRKQAFKTFLRDAVGFLEETATDAERQRMEAYMQSNGLDATGLKRHVQDVREALEEIPDQLQQIRTSTAQYRAQEQAAEPEAKKYFPWLDNKTSPEYQEAQKVLEALPDLKQRTPMHKIVLGVYVLGLREFKKLKSAEATAGRPAVAKAKVPVRVPPKPPTGGAAAPAAARVNGSAAAETAARAQFEKAPTAENVARLFKIGLRS